MPALESFHETRFPLDISLGAVGGPVRKTEIVKLVSGHEKRNSKWAQSRRNFNAGFGVKTIDDLQSLVAFFEERRGQLYGFRFRDPLDYKSCTHSQTISSTDQNIGNGDGTTTIFQLQKRYGSPANGYIREISKPVDLTVKIAVEGIQKLEGQDFTLDETTGEVIFLPTAIPTAGAEVSAGFEFDVPVRFGIEEMSINLSAFEAGEIPSIPLIEIKT